MTFADLALSPKLLARVTAAGYTTPTPIQAAAIPVALERRDLIGCAQTGTGKTAAFLLPILERFQTEEGVALILAPTRELAAQIMAAAQQLAPAEPRLRIALVVGGVAMGPQIRDLSSRPRLIIATPGRLIDHLQRGSVDLGRVNVLVLDEADRMLDMGFAPQIERILRRVPKLRQTMLFSATMPSAGDPRWRDVLAIGLDRPVRLAVDPPKVAEKAEQELWLVESDRKMPALLDLLDREPGQVLVFTRTKHRADRVARQISQAGHRTDRIHGDRTQGQRTRALAGFKSSGLRVLVATDIAARGIDVEGVAHVVNYDLPADPEDYLHRVGRTARAARTGRATSFVLREERSVLKQIERLTGRRLPPLMPVGA
jgi:ATP-dependent RNA helicase RhlE